MGIEANNIQVPNYEDLEVVKEGNSSLTFTIADSVVTTIPHNLGYVPIALVYIVDGSLYTPLPTKLAVNFDLANDLLKFNLYFDYNVDSTNLYINFYSAAASGSFSGLGLKYYLLRNKAR